MKLGAKVGPVYAGVSTRSRRRRRPMKGWEWLVFLAIVAYLIITNH